MSNPGNLLMMTADGRVDEILHAQQVLRKRMREIAQRNRAMGASALVKIKDIAVTHVIPFHTFYQPHLSIGVEYQRNNSNGGANLGDIFRFNIQMFGEFWSDIAFDVALTAPAFASGGSADEADEFRWADLPGARLCEKVSFTINGSPISEYTSRTMAFYRDLRVSATKRPGFDRCVGQQEVRDAYFQENTQVAPVAERVWTKVTTGAQTPSPTSSALRMWIPTLFWFCDPTRAVPSVAIPNGQRFIDLKTPTYDKLCYFRNRGGAVPTLSAPTVSISMYVCNIFVREEVHNLFIRRVGFYLVNLFVEHTQAVTVAKHKFRLSSFKWPISYMMFGLQPDVNNASSSDTEKYNALRLWNQYSSVTATNRDVPNSVKREVATDLIVEFSEVALTEGTPNTFDWSSVTAANGDTDGTMNVLFAKGALKVVDDLPARTIDVVSLEIHSQALHRDMDVGFFNSYLQYQWGGDNIAVSQDAGKLFLPFGTQPGSKQAQGYLNASRARELYLELTSSVSGSVNCTAHAIGDAFNFFLVAEGSGVVRYA